MADLPRVSGGASPRAALEGPRDFPVFPPRFLWGVATASYQIEGAAGEDGRGTSIWDTFSHAPGKTLGGDTGDVACDHYHRYREDVELMARLGVGAYRFSIAWPRIQPDGRGPANQRGLDFYRRLLDALDEHAIEACVTLYHWDLPQALEEAGGWLSRETAYRFAEYAEIVGRAFGDRVALWAPINEAFVHWSEGYGLGVCAPGRGLLFDAFPAAHHLTLGHGLATRALRAAGVRGLIGSVNNLTVVRPASTDLPDLIAAGTFDLLRNWLFADPLILGGYPADLMEALPKAADVAKLIQPGDEAIAAARLDFFGLNYYGPEVVKAAPGSPLGFDWEAAADAPRTGMGTLIDPDGLPQVLAILRDRYGSKLPPVYVTENGASFQDQPDASDRVKDTERIAYLDAHMRALRGAIDDGADVRGYFLWSLLDNFEWALGYSQRFGIVYTNFETQRRTPKASFDWYRDLIAAQR